MLFLLWILVSLISSHLWLKNDIWRFSSCFEIFICIATPLANTITLKRNTERSNVIHTRWHFDVNLKIFFGMWIQTDRPFNNENPFLNVYATAVVFDRIDRIFSALIPLKIVKHGTVQIAFLSTLNQCCRWLHKHFEIVENVLLKIQHRRNQSVLAVRSSEFGLKIVNEPLAHEFGYSACSNLGLSSSLVNYWRKNAKKSCIKTNYFFFK